MLHTLWRMLRTRPRLLSAVLTGLACWLIVPPAWMPSPVTRALVAWNLGVLLYQGLVLAMMRSSSHARMRERAQLESEGRWAVLGLVSLCALSSLVAIALQLGVARELHGGAKLAHMGLAGLTVLFSWAFMQTIFALHYAHEFYVARSRHAPDGLAFPGTADPDYLDFLYLACVVGTSGQTADVSFSSQTMRRTGLLHCVLAFFFNTTVLALAINMAAGLI